MEVAEEVMVWSRAGRGRYRSGDFVVRAAGGFWSLWLGGVRVGVFAYLDEAKARAERMASGEEGP